MEGAVSPAQSHTSEQMGSLERSPMMEQADQGQIRVPQAEQYEQHPSQHLANEQQQQHTQIDMTTVGASQQASALAQHVHASLDLPAMSAPPLSPLSSVPQLGTTSLPSQTAGSVRSSGVSHLPSSDSGVAPAFVVAGAQIPSAATSRSTTLPSTGGMAASNGRVRANTSGYHAGSAVGASYNQPLSNAGPSCSSHGGHAGTSPRMTAQFAHHNGVNLGGSSHGHGHSQGHGGGHGGGHVHGHGGHGHGHGGAASYERYTAELTNCIIAFLSPILPTEEEYRIKEATRRQLERLAARVSPGAKLLAFGSMANGFALRNSGE